MKTTEKKIPGSIFKNLGVTGIGLCLVCCLLPIAGTILGVGALTTLAIYLEKIGLILLIASATFFAIWYIKKRLSAPYCDINCSTKKGYE